MSRQPGLFETPGPPKRRVAAGDVLPASQSPLLEAPNLPSEIRLGTSSWFFPGWRGLVYESVHQQTALSRKGLAAYGQIPMLRTVSLDRTFYAAISAVEYARYAGQVPDDFSFVVKAPALVCDAVMRDRPEHAERYLKEQVPCNRFGKPSEIAPLVAFACSQHASFMHGALLSADGGLSKHFWNQVA